jgi:competence protein ComEA
MKRIPAVLAAVVAMAFVATVAMADDTTAPATAAPAKAAPAKTTSTTSTTHHHSSSSSKSTKTPKTDLNTASKEDLMKLPGVDDAIADKIIAARPYKNHSELESKNIVTKEQYSKLSAKVTVAPPQKSAAK